MERQTIEIPVIVLEWTDWKEWNYLKADARTHRGASVPPRPGVYEARLKSSRNRLTIGRSSNLRFRVKQALLKGKTAAGEKIRRDEDVSAIVIRWARTDRPAAAEEELHKRHKAQFGSLPKHTGHT